MTMTNTNDSRDIKPIGAQFVTLCEAYEALQNFMDGRQPEHALLSALNDGFRAALDEADRLGLLT
jgi:hypothetical protein